MPANAEDAGDTGLIPRWEDLLEKEMATHSSILAWRIPWTERPGLQSGLLGYSPWNHKESDMPKHTHQWLRLCAPTVCVCVAGRGRGGWAQVQFLVGETKIPHATQPKPKANKQKIQGLGGIYPIRV